MRALPFNFAGLQKKSGAHEVADRLTRKQLIAALAEHPKLIQRPIITLDDGTPLTPRPGRPCRTKLVLKFWM